VQAEKCHEAAKSFSSKPYIQGGACLSMSLPICCLSLANSPCSLLLCGIEDQAGYSVACVLNCSLVYMLQVAQFWVHNKATVGEFKRTLANKWGTAIKSQRLWPWQRRQNLSVRLSSPVDSSLDGQRLADVTVRFLPSCDLQHETHCRCLYFRSLQSSLTNPCHAKHMRCTISDYFLH